MTPRPLRLAVLLAPTILLAACGGGADTASLAAASATPPAEPEAIVLSGASHGGGEAGVLQVPVQQANRGGAALTATSSGTIDHSNAFFKAFGNGRSCATCHDEGNGWTIGPGSLAARFNISNGTDPIFKLVDGANSPLAATATLDQKKVAYSMLLTKGLIRVGLPMPATAEFSLQRVDDPYRFASAKELSLFRRPLPSTNLKFASSLMWDGRETFADPRSTTCILNARPAQCFASIDTDLLHQSNSAVRGHAEAAQDLTAAEQRSIVDFEKALFTAQVSSSTAGSLTTGVLGGPVNLAQNNFYFGINDVEAGDYVTRAPFDRNVFNLFSAWRGLDRPAPPPPPQRGRPAPPPAPPSAQDIARASIARGEQLFNTRPMNIVGVNGFNDELRVPLQRGTCSSCHNAPNAGSHSVARMFNTGTAAANLRTPDLPLYTLRNTATGEVIETSDPGAALLTGRWRDIGKVKTPNLRGLEARAPYFHNGSAQNLEDVVRFYDRRFRMGLTPQDVNDLSAFLRAL